MQNGKQNNNNRRGGARRRGNRNATAGALDVPTDEGIAHPPPRLIPDVSDEKSADVGGHAESATQERRNRDTDGQGDGSPHQDGNGTTNDVVAAIAESRGAQEERQRDNDDSARHVHPQLHDTAQQHTAGRALLLGEGLPVEDRGSGMGLKRSGDERPENGAHVTKNDDAHTPPTTLNQVVADPIYDEGLDAEDMGEGDDEDGAATPQSPAASIASEASSQGGAAGRLLPPPHVAVVGEDDATASPHSPPGGRGSAWSLPEWGSGLIVVLLVSLCLMCTMRPYPGGVKSRGCCRCPQQLKDQFRNVTCELGDEATKSQLTRGAEIEYLRAVRRDCARRANEMLRPEGLRVAYKPGADCCKCRIATPKPATQNEVVVENHTSLVE